MPIERAPSGRATCRGCGARIAAGELRVGERLPNPYGDEGAEMTHWYHLRCAAYRRPDAFLTAARARAEPFDDREALTRDAELGVAHPRLPRLNAAERSPSGRAACRACREPIAKGTWRLSLVYYEDGRFVPGGFIHAGCAGAYFETTAILDRVRHFTPSMTEADLAELQSIVPSAAEPSQS